LDLNKLQSTLHNCFDCVKFLSDILGKKSKKLNFRTKPIGFREERKELCVVPQKTQNLQKTVGKNVFEKEQNLFLNLIPRSLPKRKIVDIYLPQKSFNLNAVYRLFQISPQKFLIKQEVLRFGVIGLTAVVILNLIGAFSAGLTLKKDIEVQAVSVYENIKNATDAAKNQDFSTMLQSFSETTQILEEVEQDIQKELKLQAGAGLDSPLQSMVNLLRAGKHLSKAGEYSAKTIYNIKELPADFMAQNNELVVTSLSGATVTDKIKESSGYLNFAMTEIQTASEILAEVEPDYLPEEFQETFLGLENKLEVAQEMISVVQEYIPYVLDLLGDRYPKSYMILLQNNHEIRATGGFIGSYILLDLNDGEITKFELKDVYEADGQFHEKVTPPNGLHKITENWRMRDANYSPDFSTSAEQVMWFLEHEKGPTVDTVIAINQRVVENLLAKIGEVELPGTDEKITAENFSWIFSYLIEAKLADSNSPKQFLMDFSPVFKEKLLQPQNIPEILEVLQDSIERKDLMAYSADFETAMLIERFGLNGKISSIDETFDYLQVVNTSVGGNKSDGFIDQTLKHSTNVDSEGTLIDNLTITRKHTWYHAEDTIFDDLYARFGSGKLKKQELKDIVGFGGNKSLIRVYVPLGSELISSTGSIVNADVMVYEDLGKTVFAFEQEVIYTEREANINLRYKLPHQLDLKYADNYKMIVQNQPGQEQNYFEKTVALQGDGEILGQFPQSVFVDSTKRVSFGKFLEKDEYLSVVVGRR